MNYILNLLRGVLIGIAEVIPGVSGGTIALIVGVYQRIIDSAAAVSRIAASALKLRFSEIPASFRQIDFRQLLPLLAGMLLAIFGAASIIEPLLESSPEIMRGLFFGMIAISLYVPYRLAASSWQLRDYLLAALAAGLSFALLSLPRAAEASPPLLMVFFAAALAVCALVLPGVSGSFLLLAIGFYAPTIAAVNDRDFVYLGVFVLGAIVGLLSFSSALSWLLENRRKATLVVMTGLMVGSLRAIWPWQDQSGNLMSPASVEPVLAVLAGVFIVGSVMLIESRVHKAQ